MACSTTSRRGRVRQARLVQHAAGLAAARRLLHGPGRQVPERLRGHRTDNPPLVPPGCERVARRDGHLYLLRLRAERERHAGHLRRQPRRDYSTDVYTAKAVDFIDRRAPERQPFFLWLTYLAPHSGGPNPNPNPPQNCGQTAKPAPRHAERLRSASRCRCRRASTRPTSPTSRRGSPTTPRSRGRRRLASPAATAAGLESLLAIDEGVEQVIDALARAASWTTRSSSTPPTTASCTASTASGPARSSSTRSRSACRC